MLREDIVIPKSVYEERKQQFTARIKAIVSYAMNDAVCRSRQLLRYFGEEDSHDCGQCDVCIAHRRESDREKEEKEARQRILDFLADGQRHYVTELRQLDGQHDVVHNALRYLLLEEIVKTDNGWLFLN